MDEHITNTNPYGVMLTWIIAGVPQPMYRWLKNGYPLGDYSSELFYKILNTQRTDAGAYQCIAKNDVGAIFSEKNNIVVACKLSSFF